MKSVNADIPALAHKEHRTLTRTCAITEANPGMASNLDAFRPKPERTCCLVFKDRAPSRGPPRCSGHAKGLSAERPTIEPHWAAIGSRRLLTWNLQLLPVPSGGNS